MTLTDAQRTELNRPDSPNALIAFLTIEHGQLGGALRLVCDVLEYVRGGETWTPVLFDYRLVPDEGRPPRTVLTVPNVDRRIGRALRAVITPPRITLELLSSEDFDLTVVPRQEIATAAVIYEYREFEVASVEISPAAVEATVMLRDYSQEPWPFVRATQDRLPGLFR